MVVLFSVGELATQLFGFPFRCLIYFLDQRETSCRCAHASDGLWFHFYPSNEKTHSVPHEVPPGPVLTQQVFSIYINFSTISFFKIHLTRSRRG